jgi:2,4-dienoyl-CoA reductase-like NADH-dependent reductase (Old Yellow Enzyme family)
MPAGLFDPFQINDVTFKHRVLRSSIGGRTAYYDGTVNNAWANFEMRFAAPEGIQQDGVAAIISATFTVDDQRWAPLEYPKISHDKFIAPLSRVIRHIQTKGCRYILQIGDPGYHTQTSLFNEAIDGMSASKGFDLLYGYRNLSSPMDRGEINRTIQNFADAARRVRESGCDGVEITASKGYLIHQFLNPAVNRRRDEYGGSLENRFRLLSEIVGAARSAVGSRYLLGIRISARDLHYLPYLNLRWPPRLPFSRFWRGNRLQDMLQVGQWLKNLGVDYLHVSNGFGFINPAENPGLFPARYVRQFAASTAHLSFKAKLRYMLSLAPSWLGNLGWSANPNRTNLADAIAFRNAVGLPVIANGGLHTRAQVEEALKSVELVSMARPLLAEPGLIRSFRTGEQVRRPCTRCNNCTVATSILPLGCYEPRNFASIREMEEQIQEWSANPTPLADEAASAR